LNARSEKVMDYFLHIEIKFYQNQHWGKDQLGLAVYYCEMIIMPFLPATKIIKIMLEMFYIV
jgi:hypothetical protein